jgi:hypothetical protein
MAEQKDNSGQTYTTQDNRPAQNGTTVTLTDRPNATGTMIGGTVVVNK